jgi:hypothetical protein
VLHAKKKSSEISAWKKVELERHRLKRTQCTRISINSDWSAYYAYLRHASVKQDCDISLSVRMGVHNSLASNIRTTGAEELQSYGLCTLSQGSYLGVRRNWQPHCAGRLETQGKVEDVRRCVLESCALNGVASVLIWLLDFLMVIDAVQGVGLHILRMQPMNQTSECPAKLLIIALGHVFGHVLIIFLVMFLFMS